MADIQIVFGWPGLQRTRSVAEAVVGGQLVERRTGTNLVGVAGNGSAKVDGVAINDVPVARTTITGVQVGDGDELRTARGYVVAPLVASGAIAVGDKLCAAAAGKARAYVAGTDDASLVFGEADAAAADGATFNALIY